MSMKTLLLAATLSLAFLFTVVGETEEVRGTVLYQGRYYKNAKVLAVNPSGTVNISSKEGQATVPMSALPEPMRSQTAAWAQEQVLKQKRRAAADATRDLSTFLIGRVVQIGGDGILMEITTGKIMLKGLPAGKKIAVGDAIHVRGAADGAFDYINPQGTKELVRVYKFLQWY